MYSVSEHFAPWTGRYSNPRRSKIFFLFSKTSKMALRSIKAYIQRRLGSFFLPWRSRPSRPRPPHFRGFMITLRHTTVGRTPIDEQSARRRDINLTTHNTHNRQTFMTPEGFEPAIPASERPQTHALDHAATGVGIGVIYCR